MPEGNLTPSCARHPQLSSVANCDRCGRPLCEQCRVESVATEQVFCSEHCREASVAAGLEQETVSNRTLRAGLKKPIRTGWALWARSVSVLLASILPLAVVLAPLWWYVGMTADAGGPEESDDVLLLILTAVLLLVGAYGVALVGIVLSKRYTGLVHGNPHAKALRRLLPWVTTWILVIAITLAGYVALVFPGIYLAIRLFWADEFALVHDKGPISALKASWELTRKAAGPVFVFQFVLGLAQYVILVPAVILLAVSFAWIASLGWTTAESFSILEAFLMVFVGLTVYSAMHAPEIVQFYGMRAARASLHAAELEQGSWLDREKNRPL